MDKLNSRQDNKDITHFRNISEKLNLIWLAPSRTATRTLYQLLKNFDFKIHVDYEYIEKEEIIVPLTPSADYTHDFDILPRDKDLKIICSVKNPYSRLIGVLKYHNIFREKLLKSDEKTPETEEKEHAFRKAYDDGNMVMMSDEEFNNLFDGKPSFEEWIDKCFIKKSIHKIWLDQIYFHEYLKLHKPSYYIRTENLVDDLLYIPEIRNNITEEAKHAIEYVNYVDFKKEVDDYNIKEDWRDFYSEEIADLVYRELHEQFEMFGYSRDSWKKPIEKINIDYIDGVRIENQTNRDCEFEIVGAPNHPHLDPINFVFTDVLKPHTYIKIPIQYYKKWQVKINQKDRLEYNETFDLKGKNVLIVFITAAIGDSLAWIPYVEEFRKKHECNVFCVTYQNKLFEKEYPLINFIEPEAGKNILKEEIYARYFISQNQDWEYLTLKDSNDKEIRQGLKTPVDFRRTSLQLVATNVLGLEPEEIKPKITVINKKRPIEQKYVCISEHSRHKAKYWNNPLGWQELVDWLNLQGYKVMVISEEKTKLNHIVNRTGLFPLSDRINQIQHAEFFISISTGLSWIAWALNKKVVMISGFTDEYCEFQDDNIRIINKEVCHGCWHKHNIDLTQKNWCPEHFETSRHFECTKMISSEMVINKIISSGLIR